MRFERDFLAFQFPLSERTNCNCATSKPLDSNSSRFQFPLSERTNCNTNAPRTPPAKVCAFSFLYRNERTATLHRAVVNFCPARLSVSSIGTNELQLAPKWRARCLATPFSFLYRNERTATEQKFLKAVKPPRLSVSSIGTNELQLARADDAAAPPARFQFPLSERTNCNFKTRQTLRSPTIAFSFLYRNERTATTLHFRQCLPLHHFQFPLSERTNCNSVALSRLQLTPELSVSSIGTNELQPACPLSRRESVCTFSFLYRNERTAT